jgi:hypothetical protein
MKALGLLAAALAAGCYSPTLGPVGFYCHPDDQPACPDGYTCKSIGSDYRCVSSSSDAGISQASLVPKTGAPYSGPHNDPMLASLEACPDYSSNPALSLEPNDDADHAIDLASGAPPIPDMPTPKLVHLAICPTGNNPATGNHDIDYFKVDTTGFGHPTLSMMAEIFYDVTYGDLDVGIFDGTGRLLAGDGSAVTNGCAAASIGSGIYYVAVVGANNMDVNRYDIRIRTFTASHPCPTAGGADGGT